MISHCQSCSTQHAHTQYGSDHLPPTGGTLPIQFNANGVGNNMMLVLLQLIVSLLQQLQGQDNGGETMPEEPAEPYLGDQSPVQASTVGNQTELTNNDGSASYSNAFLRDALATFQQSDAYPDVQSKDLVMTEWGYEGSGSALTAFYNYVLDTHPEGHAPNPLGDQSPVQSTTLGNYTQLSNGTDESSYFNEYLVDKLSTFRESPDYPQVESKDLVTTEWGYSGSSTALNAFYNYMLDNYGNIGMTNSNDPNPF